MLKIFLGITALFLSFSCYGFKKRTFNNRAYCETQCPRQNFASPDLRVRVEWTLLPPIYCTAAPNYSPAPGYTINVVPCRGFFCTQNPFWSANAYTVQAVCNWQRLNYQGSPGYASGFPRYERWSYQYTCNPQTFMSPVLTTRCGCT